jgi:hypothetical protein
MKVAAPLRPGTGASSLRSTLPHFAKRPPVARHRVNLTANARLRRLSWTTRFLPMALIQGYLTLTVALFTWGPWVYRIDNPVSFYVFLFFVQAALLGGYLTAMSGKAGGYSGKWSVKRLLWWSAISNLLLFLPTSLYRTGSVLPDVEFGLANPAMAYADSLYIREQGIAPLVEYARVMSGPVLVLVLPLTIFFWPTLSKVLRTLGLVAIIGTVSLFIGMGTNRAIGETVILVPLMLLASHLAGLTRIDLRRMILFSGLAFAAIVLFLSFFGTNISTRSGNPIASGFFYAADSRADYNNRLITSFGEQHTSTILSLDYYLTGGYYALSLALQEPFVPMFGVGNSMFLTRQAARMLGDDDILLQPYPFRIEKYGWNGMNLWATIYPWLASDLSFPGTIVAVFLIGRLFALSWIDTLGGVNPFAVTMFYILLVMLFFFPATNAVLQDGEGVASFWVTLILWLKTRRRSGGPGLA